MQDQDLHSGRQVWIAAFRKRDYTTSQSSIVERVSMRNVTSTIMKMLAADCDPAQRERRIVIRRKR
jgi:hypothetical protein